jgi:hypothetical protein
MPIKTGEKRSMLTKRFHQLPDLLGVVDTSIVKQEHTLRTRERVHDWELEIILE